MDVIDLTLAEASRAIGRKRLSPLDYVDGLLAWIDRIDPYLHAFIALDRHPLRAAAAAATEEIARDGQRHPLHGLPFGVKDIIDVAGYPTLCGTTAPPSRAPLTRDAAAVAHLRRAGALPMGKLATLEYAIGGVSFEQARPPVGNPWDHRFFPGGSSSGPGSAVGGRMLPAALGSDTGGSIRHPAAHCGLVGLKPTFGLTSNSGVFPLAHTLDHLGPMTRTVFDNALMLEGMTGVATGAYTRRLDDRLRGRRIGYLRGFHRVDLEAHSDVTNALEEVVATFRREGAEIVELSLPPLSDFDPIFRVIMLGEAAAIHRTHLLDAPETYESGTRQRLYPGLFLSAADYIQAQRRRTMLASAVDEALKDVDALLCANSMDPSCRLDDTDQLDFIYMRQARTPFNLSGHPAVALMCGRAVGSGMPLSFQLVGRMRGEAELYALAAGYERATPWSAMRPEFSFVGDALKA